MTRIAIYADRESKASPSPIDREVRRVFNAASITVECVDRADLRRASFYRDLMLFILPGIEGETSRYHLDIGPANDAIRSYVAQGGALFAQCAGACYAARRTLFTPEWAPHRRRDEGLLGLFNGVAHGPLPGLGVDGEDPRHYRGLTSADILIEAGPYTRTLKLVYTSGPTFIPDPGQEMHVIARYAAITGAPPAIIRFGYGRGLVMLSGPVPQNGATPPTGIGRYETLDALLERVRPYEQQRMLFFDALMRVVRVHAQRTGVLPARRLYRTA